VHIFCVLVVYDSLLDNFNDNIFINFSAIYIYLYLYMYIIHVYILGKALTAPLR